MGYEIWDRDAPWLFEMFDTEAQALAYLREMVKTLDAERTAQILDRMQLVRFTDEGRHCEVLMAGVGLFPLIFADVEPAAN